MAFNHEIINSELNAFTIRMVKPGEEYGRDMCLSNESGQCLVEFYDREYDFQTEADGTILGQFVSRYYLSTLLSGYDGSRGLNLDGGIKKWSLDKDALTYGLEVCIEALGFGKWKIHEAAFLCTIFDFPRFTNPFAETPNG